MTIRSTFLIRYSVALFIIAFCTEILGYSQKQLLIQAEKADTISHGSIENTNQGYTGTGYVEFDNTLSAYAVWMINIPDSAKYNVIVRFSNGGTHRSINVFVNNKLIQSNLNFFPTGSWTIWDTLSFQADFINGLNNLKFTGTNPRIGPDIDWLSISNPDVNLEVAPVAVNDTISVSSKAIGLINPLANDYDRNGDILHIVSWTNPLHGMLDTIQGGNEFQYKPEKGYLGLDSFNYTISDVIKDSSAWVIIRIFEIDWSVEMSNMILNTASSHMDWIYEDGLLLEGIMRVYKRTNDVRYLNFIKEWAEYHIAEDGTIMNDPTTINELINLDNIMPGFLVLHLYKETGIEKFKLAADKIRLRFDTYPRNPDSCFWHGTDLPGQLWLDGLYMGMPFMVTYGKMFNDENYAYSEAIRQFKKHIDYLMDKETGLLYHAYDYYSLAPWALPPYKRSPYVWGRAVGWTVMGLTEILDIIPEGFPQRDSIVNQYITVLKVLAKYQDPNTGLWYQVVDHQTDPRNWLETSCSSMYVYSMSRAIQKGFLDTSYSKNVELGYSGVLSKISEDDSKMVYLKDICEGTDVSADIQYYFDRVRYTNDYHGLGSFLIMNEMLGYNNLPWVYLNVKKIQADGISIYPNPCKDYVELKMEGLAGNIQIEVYNISGMKISSVQKAAYSGVARIDMSGFPTGIYFIRIQSEGNIYTGKLIKQ
jgi:unsaturated rhamnogalacturonyl hydrolase